MALIDDVIGTVNQTLLTNLPWLDSAYGKIQRMTRKDALGNEINFPGLYVGNDNGNVNPDQNDYINVLPDRRLGNYLYWEVSDPTGYDNINRNISVTFNFKIAIWFDWRDIWPADWKIRSIEEVKAMFLNVLVAAQYTRTIEVFQMYEDVTSIFQNFTNQGYISAYDHKALEGQFLMKPYGGIAISGRVHSMPACMPGAIAPTIPLNLFGVIPFTHSFVEQIWPFEKWLGGASIKCRTWSLGTGVDGYEVLDGIAPSTHWIWKKITNSEHIPTNTIDTLNPTIEKDLILDQYRVETYSENENYYITLLYIDL